MIEWVAANSDDLLQLLLAIIGAASVIAKLTPTPKDDSIIAKIVDVVNKIALNPKK